MKRRILAYGTDEEMCLLEHECLKNRKEKKWNRYYNVSLGAPWLDQWGEKNLSYKHGLTHDPQWKKEYLREYYEKNKDRLREQYKEYRKKNRKREREWAKEYRKNNKDKISGYQKKWQSKPENIEKKRAYGKEYRKKNKDKILENQRIRRAKKKAERLASGATLPI